MDGFFNWNNFEIKNSELTIKNIKDIFKSIDDKFFKTYDKQKFRLIKTRVREIKTEYGIIKFNRRIYKELATNKNVALADKAIGIKYRSRLTENLKNKILRFMGDGKRYRDIIDVIPKSKISKSTISRLFKNADALEFVEKKINIDDKDFIYINTDECYLNLRNNGIKWKHRFRIVNFYTGKISKGKKFVLENKKVAYIMTYYHGIEALEFVDFIKEKIEEFYEFDNLPKLIVGGDGAPYIKASAMWLDAAYILDKYHPLKRIKYTFVRNDRDIKTRWDKYKLAKQYLYEGNSQKLIDYLKEQNASDETVKYFKKNSHGIDNQSSHWNIGVNAESTVFHLIKSLTGTGAKIYHFQTFENMVIARANQINNF